MKNQYVKKVTMTISMLVAMAFTINIQALEVDELVGTWNMTYDNQLGPQTGTITVSKADDGSAKIVMATSGGGSSDAKNIAIDGDTLTFSRDVNVQGQSLAVNYTAQLMEGQLKGSFTLDLGGQAAALGAAAGPTAWTATRAN